MKNSFFLMTLILIVLIGKTAQAQNMDPASDSVNYVYCQLVGTQRFLSTKVIVRVDFGQERKFFQDTRMRDEKTGDVQAFNSMVDARNYMGERGWEFVQAYVVTMGNQNVYHWLLKKRK